MFQADSNSPKVYGRFDLTKNRSIKIEADVETDQSGSYAYFLYGNKVSPRVDSKEPITHQL